MSHALIHKLQSFGPLPEKDKELIVSLTKNVSIVEPRLDIISEGDKPRNVNLVIDGFAFRYKAMPEGSRQILAYLLPGDFCDLHISLLNEMDHSIAALTEVKLVQLSENQIKEFLGRPCISRAMLTSTLVDEAVLREWLANIGQRSAEMRIAHFLCEWYRRLCAVGRAEAASCEFPITQAEIGETTGLSTVHVNRSIQSLRDKNLLILKQKRLAFPNINALSDLCGFNSKYLHLHRPT